MYRFLKIIELPVCIIIAVVLRKIAFDYAYLERGYYALGGEIFVFPMALALSAYFYEHIIRRLKPE